MLSMTDVTYERPPANLDMLSRDFAQSVYIIQNCFETNVSLTSNHLHFLLTNKKVFWAKNQAGVLGYAIYQLYPHTNSLHLLTLAVHPKYQNKHIGSQLVESVINEAKKQHIPVTLHCRPANEPFYRKLGFKTRSLPASEPGNHTAYHRGYYKYPSAATPTVSVQVHGLFMQSCKQSAVPPEEKTAPCIKPEDRDYAAFQEGLRLLAAQVKDSSSTWYGGWMATFFNRSKRKEQAFDAIICELKAMTDKATINRKFQPAEVLKAIVHNALIIRGMGIVSHQTTSGQALLQLLNTPQFKFLKDLIKPGEQGLRYKDLVDFSELRPNTRSIDTPAPFSPYRHF